MYKCKTLAADGDYSQALLRKCDEDFGLENDVSLEWDFLRPMRFRENDFPREIVCGLAWVGSNNDLAPGALLPHSVSLCLTVILI